MRKRIKCGLCLLLALMTLLLTGCDAVIDTLHLPRVTQGQVFVPRLDPNRACTLRVLGSYRSFPELEQSFAAFRRYYPHVELVYSHLPNYNSAILTALEAEEKPNLFFTNPWMLEDAVYYRVFDAAEDLSDRALGLDLSCVREGLLYRDPAGKVPMAPILSNACGMLVNEALFEKIGVPVPTSFSALLDACDRFRASGIASPALGSVDDADGLPYALGFPVLCGALRDDPAAVDALNDYAEGSGETLRGALNAVYSFFDCGCANLERCLALEDSNDKMLLRFLEGDVPMLLCGADIASGTASRERQSSAFLAHPFPYSFRPIPVTEEGGWFQSSVLVALSVCRDCDNLDMTNEFLRFLMNTQELNALARARRLVTVTRDFTADPMFAAFGDVDAAHTVYPQSLRLQERVLNQFHKAAFAVAVGKLSVDEAVAAYGLMI